jgi:hypothetical protein
MKYKIPKRTTTNLSEFSSVVYAGCVRITASVSYARLMILLEDI